MYKSRLAVFLFLTINFSHLTVAQSVGNDTLFIASAREQAIQLYIGKLTDHANLFYGSKYYEPRQTNDQHPFFKDPDWVMGSIEYNGQVYNDIPLLFDITTKTIITEVQGSQLALVGDKVRWFTIGKCHFESVDSKPYNGLAAGFYEIIYSGRTQFIAMHDKKNIERVEDRRVERYFEYKVKCFILKNGIYHRVFNKNGLLKLMEDKKNLLRPYISKHNLRFKKNSLYGSIAAVVSYYDTLSN